MVFSPGDFGGSDDYFRPDQLKKAYETRNPGKSFESFLNEAETKHGSMDSVRKGLTKPTPKKPTPKKPTPKKPTPKKQKK